MNATLIPDPSLPCQIEEKKKTLRVALEDFDALYRRNAFDVSVHLGVALVLITPPAQSEAIGHLFTFHTRHKARTFAATSLA